MSDRYDILLIDNDSHLLMEADLALGRVFSLRLARGSQEARHMLSSGSPSVVVLDLQLDDDDGEQLTEEGISLLGWLRETCPDSRLIVYSTHIDSTVQEACLAKGADLVLSKWNVTLNNLEKEIHALVGSSQ